jgi:hypothetical protein
MRSKVAAILVGGAFLFAGAPMALAKTAEHQFSGVVSHLDSAARTLAVKNHDGGTGKEMKFALASDAKIMQGSQARGLGQLKIGERVKVTYADQGSTHQAKRIDVLPARTARAASAKSPGTEPKSSN